MIIDTAQQSLSSSLLRPCLTIGCVVKTVVDVRGVVRCVGAVVVHVEGATVVVPCERVIRYIYRARLKGGPQVA